MLGCHQSIDDAFHSFVLFGTFLSIGDVYTVN